MIPATCKRHLLKKYWPYLNQKYTDTIGECTDGTYRKALLLKIAFTNLRDILKIMFGRMVVMEYVELVITTKCTLSCKYCSNLMQFYGKNSKPPYDVNLDDNIKSSEILLKLVEQINNFTILGGEPFLYKDLDKLISWLTRQSKIMAVTVVTNGTIMPVSKELFSVLKHPKCCVAISDYGELSKSKNVLINKLQLENIKFELRCSDGYWTDFGDLISRGRSSSQLSQQFHTCRTTCKSMLNGKLFYCFRSTHLNDLGIIEESDDNYLDLFQNEIMSEKRIKLKKILYGNMKYIYACDFCDYATVPLRRVKAGIQEEKR